jgi:hypothetical protein
MRKLPVIRSQEMLMRLATLSILVGVSFGAHAVMPLTVENCKTMKTEALRQQCLLSAVDAPANITGKTYSTNDVPQRAGPAVVEQPAAALPFMPYVNITPGSRPGNGQRSGSGQR